MALLEGQTSSSGETLNSVLVSAYSWRKLLISCLVWWLLLEDVIAASLKVVATVRNWANTVPAATLPSQSKWALYFPAYDSLNQKIKCKLALWPWVSSSLSDWTSGSFSQFQHRQTGLCEAEVPVLHVLLHMSSCRTYRTLLWCICVVSLYVNSTHIHPHIQHSAQTQGDKISKNHSSKS